jgi:ADP-heptose:LPS heptosyltransferase
VTRRPEAVVLRALGLGDTCAAVPALRAVRRALPDHHLVLAAPTGLAPLVEAGGLAHELRPCDGLDRPLPAGPTPPDVAVNLHGRGPRSHRLLGALEPRRLVAFGAPGCPTWEEDEHEVDRWCRLVAASFGVEVDPTDLRIDPPMGDPPAPAAAVVHCGAKDEARRWPADRFGRVVRWLRERGLPVVLTGSADERPVVREAVVAAGCASDPACRVLAGATDLGDLLRLVAAAPVVVCGDTGVAHLATALGRPSVVLFGPTPPTRWGPSVDGPHTVLWAGRTGDPHARHPDEGLLEIGVAEVLVALEQRLAVPV